MRLDRLRRAFRRPSGSAQPVVLVYHRIGSTRDDPQLLAVTAEHFAEHLEVISLRHQPLALGDLVAATRRGRAPNRAIAVTFDDGYADNLVAAKPQLARYSVPATVFVASGCVGRAFWWDELHRLLLGPKRLPRVISLEVDGQQLRFDLGEEAEEASRRSERWTVLDEDRLPAQRAYRLLSERLRVVDVEARERALEQLRALAGADGRDGDLPRPLTADELRRLAGDGLVDIGAHTVTHPVLARLESSRQRAEISGSKAQLEETLNGRVRSFAYPYGTAADFEPTTVSLVEEAGFDYACTNVPGRVTKRTHRFELPRVLIRDWDGDEFARRLSSIPN
jgi:peptidoglycan/xylan/chitin deacetylase (PgdA/CDA1 family)